MHIKTIGLALALALGGGVLTHAQEWIDMSDLITNRTFVSDASGWTISASASNQGVQYGVMEFWNGTFDINQTLTGLPDGRYRVGVQAFYRVADFNTSYQNHQNGSENLTAYFYANDAETQVASLLSYSESSSGAGNWQHYWRDSSSGYYPNDRQSTNQAFENGGYKNSLEVDVTGGSLKIGLRNSTFVQNNWCPFDNFTLEYWGVVTDLTGLTLSADALDLLTGESLTLTATPVPADATYPQVTWSSSDESVVKVTSDGVVTALKTGTAVITATSRHDSSISVSCTVSVTHTEATADQLVVNEIQSANLGMYLDATTNFSGWVEFYNPTAKSASLGGLYLSDDASDLTKWQMPTDMGVVPAGGYAVVWFDHNGDGVIVDGRKVWWSHNANFSLDPEGGTLYVSTSDGSLLLSQTYPAAVSRTSYARTTDGGTQWSFTATPTQGASNATASYSLTQLSRPEVDKQGQFFEGTLQVSVAIPEGATLRYTTDGTVPTEANGQVSETGLFSFTDNTVLRLRLFADGYLPSDVVTHTYLQGTNSYGVPVLSVVGDERYFTDDSIGICVQGVNGLRGNGQSARCNWNANWTRPVNFEMFDGDEVVVAREVGMEISGGWSRAYTKKSFKLKGDKEFATYDIDGAMIHQNTLDYPFFSQKPYIRNRTLQNRNGGNDDTYQLTDPSLQLVALTAGIDLDGQSVQPVVVYRNGQYLYNLNMREPNNKHYVYANYGWSSDEIDQFEISPDSNYVQKCGTREAWQQLYDLSASASDPVSYEQIRRLIDVDEFINYIAVELYLGGSDWPKNNIKAFRNRTDGRFRFVLMDLDFAFSRNSDIFTGFESMQNWTFDHLYDTYDANGNSVTQLTEEIEFVTIFLNLLQNDDFRRHFIDQFCLTAGSIYEPTRSEQIIDGLVSEKQTPMRYDGVTLTSKATSIKNSLKNRLSTAITALRNYSRMGLSSVTPQSVTLSQSDSAGTLFVNDLKVPCGYFNGKLFQPVTLRAQAPAGYRFVGWRAADGATVTTTLFPEGDTWLYYDQGSLDGQSWTATDYDTHVWSEGSAPLGYGNTASDYTTTLGYGGDASSKYPTYYFRKTVTLDAAPSTTTTFALNYNVDDGFIVYVNGTEAARYNMPSGTASFSTYASQYNDQNPTGTVTLSRSLFRKGDNVVAVEVHNNAANSSDIKWDASLTRSVPSSDADDYLSTEAEMELPTDATLQLEACYEALTDEERAAQHITPLRINEVSATNSVFVNDYYKKSDWVEIVNTTDEDIDMEGMYLTDNLNKPTKSQICKGTSSASTIVPAHGHAIVWCDKRDPISQLHASFKLDADGDVLMLMAADKSWADTLRYVAHDGNQTVGRYPDAADSVYVMTVPTIGKTNILSSYDSCFVQNLPTPTPDAIGDITVHSDGGLRVYVANDAVVVRSEDSPTAVLTIHTIGGAEVARVSLHMVQQRAEQPLTMLPAGTYVATARDTEGNRCAVKFSIR